MGDLLKKLREEMELTQRNLAKKAGVSMQTICNIEKGKYEPNLATIRKLCKVLKISIFEFIGEKPVNVKAVK